MLGKVNGKGQVEIGQGGYALQLFLLALCFVCGAGLVTELWMLIPRMIRWIFYGVVAGLFGWLGWKYYPKAVEAGEIVTPKPTPEAVPAAVTA